VSPVAAEYGGMKADDVKRLKELEAENATLERIVADQLVDIEGAQGAVAGKLLSPARRLEPSWRCRSGWGCRSVGRAGCWSASLHPASRAEALASSGHGNSSSVAYSERRSVPR
jgi:hypothetical protein